MKNINLYGNITRDTIFNFKEFKLLHSNSSHSGSERLGGLANIVKAIREVSDVRINIHSSLREVDKKALEQYCNLKVDFTESQTASAFILETPLGKTSAVNWGSQKIPFLKKEGWNHISYLDKIDNIEEALSLGHVNSVDLCGKDYPKKKRAALMRVFKNTDYLIISDHELNSLTLGKVGPLIKVVKKAVIIHSQKGCRLVEKNRRYTFKAPVFLKNIKLVGAGDAFVALFILYSIQNKNARSAVEKANEQTGSLLKKINSYD